MRAVSAFNSGAGGTLVSPDLRLHVAEYLLRNDDIAVCAQHCLEWLENHAGLKKAICCALDEDGKRLMGVACAGVSPLQVSEFWVDTNETTSPIIQALASSEAVRFSATARHSITPLGSESFIAVPLGKRSP